MGAKNYTAIAGYIIYWLKLLIGTLAFIQGEYKLAGLVLLIGSLLEIALYYYTISD